MRGKLRSRHAVVGLAAVVAVSVGAIAVAGAAPGGAAPDSATVAKKKSIEFEDSSVFIELNGTAGDTGLHMEIGGDPWRRLQVRTPNNKRILDISSKGKLTAQGLSGIFLESAEPPFKELSLKQFKKRFPEGKYIVKGTTIEGRKLKGSDKLTHDIPKTPVVTSPVDGGTVDPNGFVISWEPDTDKKVNIVRYQLSVSDETNPNGEVILEIGPDVTSATIDGEYLSLGGDYAAELIALERSGNQTIAAFEFKTSD